jgi:copper oxidase (laccase) domain-containing protein
VTSAPARPAVLVARNLTRAGFSHGFATRDGGVSEGALASLNFGAGDEPGRVAENVRRFAAAVGFAPEGLRQVTQVHGGRVVDAATLADAAAREEADALVLRASGPPRPLTPRPLSREGRRGGAVGVRIADCVPILIGSGAGVAAVHAGWRGVVAGVIGQAMDMLGAGDAVAAIGPCIGPCCFEVGADVAARIAEACGEPRVVVTRAGDKAKVDLRLAVRTQLARAGVRDVEDVPGCTRCEPARFFSYRRDGERSGRHLAAIALSTPRGW